MVGCTLEQFGGNAGVGNDNSEAFLRALDHLRQHGGGTLTVTVGVWETGPITISSHGTLMIEKRQR